MSDLAIEPFKEGRNHKVIGQLSCPPDKSITHRALIFSAMARGTSQITNPLLGADCLSTMQVFRDLGVAIALPNGQSKSITVRSEGWSSWKSPQHPLDYGNSGTTARLLTGVFAASPNLIIEASGDSSLNKRPMQRVVGPLQTMGADITGETNGSYLPYKITGVQLKSQEHVFDKASAQVKSCMIMAGMNTKGKTTIKLPHGSRDHTEKMLELMAAPISSKVLEEKGIKWEVVSIDGPWHPVAKDYSIPGDPSSAAFWSVLGAISLNKSTYITITNMLYNETRIGFLKALKRLGVNYAIVEKMMQNSPEPVVDLVIKNSQLKGTEIEATLIPAMIDEVPVLAVLAAFAQGETWFRGLEELRVKESDRLEQTHALLKLMGAESKIVGNDLWIKGGLEQVTSFKYNPHHDHRLAMAAAVAAKFAMQTCTVEEHECAAVSYPAFYNCLENF